MDFISMDINTITSGVNSDGVRYLELFLKEYQILFNTKVNPGCSKCISEYLIKYKNTMKKSNKESGYVLHDKYENMPLGFGSQIFVNNENITVEYAKILLSHPNGERYFSHIPDDDAPVITLELLQSNLKKAEEDLAALPVNAHHKTKEKHEKAVATAKEAIVNFEPGDSDLPVIGAITVTGTEEQINETKQE
jgi:hypothetical protein